MICAMLWYFSEFPMFTHGENIDPCYLLIITLGMVHTGVIQ